MSQGMRRISAVFFSRRPPVEPPPEPEKKRPPIHPPERTPKPKPIQDPPVPPPPGKKPGEEPTPIGDPPGEADQPIRVKRGRPGSIVHGVKGKEHSRHREMLFICGRAHPQPEREKKCEGTFWFCRLASKAIRKSIGRHSLNRSHCRTNKKGGPYDRFKMVSNFFGYCTHCRRFGVYGNRRRSCRNCQIFIFYFFWNLSCPAHYWNLVSQKSHLNSQSRLE